MQHAANLIQSGLQNPIGSAPNQLHPSQAAAQVMMAQQLQQIQNQSLAPMSAPQFQQQLANQAGISGMTPQTMQSLSRLAEARSNGQPVNLATMANQANALARAQQMQQVTAQSQQAIQLQQQQQQQHQHQHQHQPMMAPPGGFGSPRPQQGQPISGQGDPNLARAQQQQNLKQILNKITQMPDAIREQTLQNVGCRGIRVADHPRTRNSGSNSMRISTSRHKLSRNRADCRLAVRTLLNPRRPTCVLPTLPPLSQSPALTTSPTTYTFPPIASVTHSRKLPPLLVPQHMGELRPV